MSPRKIMIEQEAKEELHNQETQKMPEIPSASEEEFVLHGEKSVKSHSDSDTVYANAFPEWNLLPPKVEIRRVSHKQR